MTAGSVTAIDGGTATRRWLWLLIPLLALPLLWTLLQDGLPRASDTALHMLRLELLDRSIRSGVEYPRWFPEMTLGYGYPFFAFYAPATYYAAELFHLAGLSIYGSFLVLTLLILVGSGLTMHLFARRLFGAGGEWAALTAAVAWMATPYLLTNLYLRGAFGEAAAQMLLPLVLWSLHRLFGEVPPARALPWLVISLTLLLVTHTISLLLLPPLLAAYTLLLWWSSGRSTAQLLWCAVAVVLALALSAFFWLPVFTDRQYITQAGLELARILRIPSSIWTSSNFLDGGLRFTYNFERPVRLGLVQAIVGLAGLVILLRLRQRRGEWLFWASVALVAAALMTGWALPLWQSPILSTIQTVWRLLTFVSFPLAIFAGGLALHRRRWSQPVAAAFVIGLLLWAHTPRLEWLDRFAAQDAPLRSSVLAQVEVDKGVFAGGEQNSNVQEFRPRWAPTTLALDEQPAMTSFARLRVLSADARDLRLEASSATETELRFASFYYPGWRVTVDGVPHAAYPSTRLGLLTIRLPRGEHEVSVEWAGTPVQRWAHWISLAALAGVVLATVRRGSLRLWGWIATVPLLLSVAALVTPSPLAAVTPAQAELPRAGLQLVGAHIGVVAGVSEAQLYWQVVAPPPVDLRVRLRLLDAQGSTVAESESAAFFNSDGAQAWPVGTLVDDRYELPALPSHAAGPFSLQVAAAPADDIDSAVQFVVLDSLTRAELVQELPRPPTGGAVAESVDAAVGDFAQLTGYEVRGVYEARPGLWVARAGDRVRLTLHWHATRAPAQNYVAFAHLLDGAGNGLVKEDQQPGPVFEPTGAWVSGHRADDTYLLRIPADAAGGLYAPWVGMVDPASGERLPVLLPGSTAAAEVRLPAFKVVGAEPPRPGTPIEAAVGTVAEIIGYDLALSTQPLTPGDRLTVTLHLRALEPTSQDFTRFLHLYDPTLGMAAQADAPPRSGLNPTSSWIKGEIVADSVVLTLDDDAAPGTYDLLAGFYDPASGARLPVAQEDSQSDAARLQRVTVIAAPAHSTNAAPR